MGGDEDSPERSGQEREAGESTWYDDDRERRQRALTELAQQRLGSGRDQHDQVESPTVAGTHLPPVGTLAPPIARRRVRRSRWLAAIAAVLLVAVVGVLVLLHLRPRSAAVAITAGPVAIQFGRFCVNDITWSPDGTRIAVVGVQHVCGVQDTNFTPPALLFFDGTSGKLLRQLALNTIIAQALFPSGSAATPATGSAGSPSLQVGYSHLLWSPTSGRLALPFDALNQSEPAAPPITGVLELDPSSAHAQVISHALAENQRGEGIWDLSTGAFVPLSPYALHAQPGNISGFAPPELGGPALAYQWQPNGTLRPLTPLNSAEAPAVAAPLIVGNPAGAATFGIWQPGSASVDAQDSAGALDLPGVASFQTANFGAWSPGGRYLLDDALAWVYLTDGKYQYRGPQAAHEIGTFSLAPMRDRALSALLDGVRLSAAQPNSPAYSVAWTPDGKRLAAATFAAPSDPTQPPKVSVVIYDCASGRVLARLSPPSVIGGTSPLLRWSPDGRHLLVYDGLLSAWGPGQLP